MPGPSIEVIIRHGDGLLGRHVVTPGSYVIGRDPEAAMRIDGVAAVSGRHAQLIVHADRVEIEDLGSADGTFVSGKPVTTATRLWPNQKIQVGAATIEVRRLKGENTGDDTLTPHLEAIREALPEEFLREKKYEIGGVVARGGMGAILDAREATTERTVAMKVMLEDATPGDLMRFIAEAKVTAQLEHPNIVPVHELSVDENDQVFYTMKFVQGITLHVVIDLLGRGQEGIIRKYNLGNLLTVFQKVCDAIAFAHAKNIVHRDLKPANIMMGDFGEVLVMDWGLAKRIGSDKGRVERGAGGEGETSRAEGKSSAASGAQGGTSSGSHTMAGMVMGTPQYMAPEQARGEAIDARADIYALGGILYHLLALRPAVDGPEPAEVVDRVAAGRINPLNLGVKHRHLPSGRIPDSLAAVVRKAMALRPSDRYETVADLQSDIAAYQNGFATEAEQAGAWKQLTLFVRRNAAATAGVVAALFLTAVFTAKVLDEGRRAERALADLRAAAPTMISQAHELIDQQKFDEALAKISFALEIDGQNAEYRLLRAQALEATLQLREAALEFKRVLELGSNESAAANLALCEKILRENKGQPDINATALQALHAQMVKEQRVTQDIPIAERLGLGRAATDARVKALFDAWRKLPGWGKKTWKDRFHYEADGTIFLSLFSLPIDDIRGLKDLPISSLELSKSNVSDLSPLAHMRLVSFAADSSPIADLRPLRGMPLQHVSMIECKKLHSLAGLEASPIETCYFQGSPVADLSPLSTCPLQSVDCAGTQVTSLEPLANTPCLELRAGFLPGLTELSPLRTMRLRQAHFDSDPGVRDLSPLAFSPDLEEVFLPSGARNPEALRSLTKIRQILYAGVEYTPEEFWIMLGIGDAQDLERAALIQKARSALTAAGLVKPDIRMIKVLPDGTLDVVASRPNLRSLEPLRGLPIYSLDVSSSGVTDLTPLIDMPLHELKMSLTRCADLSPLARCSSLELLWCPQCGVRDLSPLAGLPLKELRFSGNGISDLTPLAGAPLKVLGFWNNPVTSIRPLLSCRKLEWLAIPSGVEDVGELRALPRLRRLSERWDDRAAGPTGHGAPAETTDQFWKEYEAKMRAGRK